MKNGGFPSLCNNLPKGNHTLDPAQVPQKVPLFYTDGGSTVVAPGPPLDGFCADCLALCT